MTACRQRVAWCEAGVNTKIAEITDRIRQLEAELEVEFARRRVEFSFAVRGRVVQFEERVLKRHKELKSKLSRYVLGARPLLVLTALIIYAVIIPFVLLDLFITVYQFVCFPIYGIARVKRSDYLVFDRGQLAYLNAIEKFNCVYCSYGNGLIAYVREVAARTEQYWCPIKHARRVLGTHERYSKFADYGDAESYHSEAAALRKELRDQMQRDVPRK